jgi:hypothetical protein
MVSRTTHSRVLTTAVHCSHAASPSSFTGLPASIGRLPKSAGQNRHRARAERGPNPGQAGHGERVTGSRKAQKVLRSLYGTSVSCIGGREPNGTTVRRYRSRATRQWSMIRPDYRIRRCLCYRGTAAETTVASTEGFGRRANPVKPRPTLQRTSDSLSIR